MLDWFLSLLSPEGWEAWRSWLTTIGGLTAMLIAANTYRRNVRDKREEQARLVYAAVVDSGQYRAGEWLVPSETEKTVIIRLGRMDVRDSIKLDSDHAWSRVRLRNGSRELISSVYVDVGRLMPGLAIDASVGHGFVEPDSEVVIKFVWANPDRHVPQTLYPQIQFRDSSGVIWHRKSGMPIKRTRRGVLVRMWSERETRLFLQNKS